jgi:SAM-dependent methyltransferase
MGGSGGTIEPQMSCDYIFWPDATPNNLPVIAKIYPEILRGGLALDAGCGDGCFRSAVEGSNFTWVGIDRAGPGPRLLGDCMVLPFPSKTFDLVISWAVLEHVRNPRDAVGELARVIKHGALLIGAVAFLEPFHESYFHMTRWGVGELLTSSGFRLERMWPHWHLISSFSLMYNPWLAGRAVRVWRYIAPFFVKLLHAYRLSRRVRYQLPPDTRDNPQAEAMDYLTYSADIAFVARRV